ncbi:MAG: sigma-70 family RNA polymerase sigma factor [Planctomycetota bacterium]
MGRVPFSLVLEKCGSMPTEQYFLAVTGIQNKLYAFILSLLADPVAAQDVLQETNLVLVRKADDYQPDASFESWAYSTARFQVMAHLRDRNRDRIVLDEAFVLKVAPEAEVMADETEHKIRVLGACVERLSTDHRMMLQKRYGKAATMASLAKEHGKSASAIKQVLYRIRSLLAQCVKERLQEGAATS